jgi:hypothetical protein
MILNSNAPPDAAGLLMFGHGRSSGWEPFGLGIQMHIDLPWAVLPLRSDVAGVASRSFWIPRIPWLAGARFAAQTLWAGDAGLGNTCSPGRFELATSRGLGITLQR